MPTIVQKMRLEMLQSLYKHNEPYSVDKQKKNL